jgi:hypothetical protein
MAHIDVEPNRGNSYLTTILVAVVLLTLLYFMAKGCTNHHEDNAHKHSGTSTNSTH